MNSQYQKNLKLYPYIFIFAMVLPLFSCKKEVIEVQVNAFENLQPIVDYSEGVYTLKFTLQDYPYDEVGVRLSSDKAIFVKEEVVNKQIANEIAADRYAVRYDSLIDHTTYYYQIYVKDSQISRVVYSDVFSFKTNP